MDSRGEVIPKWISRRVQSCTIDTEMGSVHRGDGGGLQGG